MPQSPLNNMPMKNKTFLIILSAVIGISFVLNLIWEKLQAPLYAGFVSLPQHFWVCFGASIGDVSITLVFYLIVALFRKDIMWLKELRITDLVSTGIFGAVTAFFMEYFAIASGKWAYLSAMPLLPFTTIGLTPFFQLLILIPLTFFLTHLV